MKSILTLAAGVLAACSGPAGPGSPASGIFSPSRGPDADLLARYQQYRSGPPPHLDFETWKRLYGTPKDNSGSGP